MTMLVAKRAVLCVVMAAFTMLPLSATANSVSGQVVNSSSWSNAYANVPGNGSGTGTVCVGVWGGAAGATLVGSPLVSAKLDGPGPLPRGAGPFLYTLGGSLAPGAYHLAAWIEGGTNDLYDLGEPRSQAYNFTIVSNPVVGANVEITDDFDGDGLPDYWERLYFGNLSSTAGGDNDNDGLSNEQEYRSGLNPSNWDTDGDGMDDAWELSYAPHLNPVAADANSDADGDGLINLFEYQGLDGQAPMQQDPQKATGVARTNPMDNHDVLHPVNIDTDGDGLIDSFEAVWYDPSGGIDPKSAGNTGADPDHDGLSNYREQCLLTNLQQGAANDIWSYGPASLPLPDSKGYTRFATPIVLGPPGATIVASLTTYRTANATNSNAWTDPTEGEGYLVVSNPGHDTDGDELPDGWEIEHNLNPKSGGVLLSIFPLVWNPDGYFGDPDGDGLVNFQEYLGQDGLRSATAPYIDGTGDETNPKEHNWRPLSTAAGSGTSRPLLLPDFWYHNRTVTEGTLGSAAPTISIGINRGEDSDDDGIPDDVEIQQEYPPGSGLIGTSPVHSMSPYTNRAAVITAPEGIPVPDYDRTYSGCRPDLHSGNFTLECYVKLTVPTPMNGTIFESRGPDLPDYSNSYACVLGLSNSIPYVGFHTLETNQFYMVSGVTLPTNRWIHLAGVWDTGKNTLSLYVDGALAQQKQRIYEESLSAFLFGSATCPAIGRSPDSSFVNRLYLDEIRIWGVARSAGEIEQYRCRLVPPASTNLLAYYRFDDGGKTAEDFTRRAAKGLLGASPQHYLYGDQGFALYTNFDFVANDFAPTRGVSQWGADDSDGDGLPDDWELINLLNLNSADGQHGASGDPDGDGLFNITEFYAGTNPQEADSDQDGIADGGEDLDDDTVRNLVEQSAGSRPDIVDTDDDGYTDREEITMGTRPDNASDPGISRCIRLGGGANDYADVPQFLSQALSSWTIELWVNPLVGTANGSLLRRAVQSLTNGSYALNFELGVSNLVPYAGFATAHGISTRLFASNSTALPTGTWTYVAATFSAGTGLLTLYTNGLVAGTRICTDSPPLSGKGGDIFVRMGEGFAGFLDEVRLWNVVRSGVQILNAYNHTGDGSANGLVHDFRFDDGEANTNVVPFGKFHRPHGAQDFLFPSDWTDEWTHAARLVGAVAFVEPGAFVPPPSLRIILEPEAARLAGCQWNYDGSPWYDSATLLDNLIAGQHAVAYKSIQGWTSPSDEIVSITNGIALTLTRTYVQQAALTVNISPAEAIAAGAHWRLDAGAWLDSGTTVSNLDTGLHNIEYSALANWTAPTNETVNLAPADAITLARQYSRPSICTVILPTEAVTAGARWNLDGGPWTNSNVTIPVPTGTHTVNFSSVTGWLPPNSVVTQITSTSSAFVTGTYFAVTAFGAYGTNTGFFRTPRGLAFDSRHQLYVADYANHRVQRYDMAAREWTVFGQYGTSPPSNTLTYFNNPNGLCVDAADNLYVADQNNDRIQCRNAGSGNWTVVPYNGRGSGIGQFIGPSDVAVDTNGVLYVADMYNHRVQTSIGGTWRVLISEGTNAGFVYFPRGMFIDETDTLYVSDSGPGPNGHSRIQSFLTNGQYLATLGTRAATNGGLLQPGGIAKYSTILYVADTDNNRVTTCNLALSSWSPLALATNYLSRPEDLATQLRWLFISDTGNNRLVRIVIDYGPSTVWATTVVPMGGGSNRVTVAWDALPEWRYDLEYSTDLVVWFPVTGVTNIVGTNDVMTGVDIDPSTPPTRYYRVRAF